MSKSSDSNVPQKQAAAPKPPTSADCDKCGLDYCDCEVCDCEITVQVPPAKTR